MRRLLLPKVLMALFLAPAIASAKLPFYGLDVNPIRPRVGEPITLTMTCYHDEDHTQPMPACMGTGSWGRMAWVHPLDEEGRLDQSDWIAVEGHATSSGATRGRITLDEPGAYDVMPPWRTWGTEAHDGFPGSIRIEVTDGERITSVALAAFGVAGTCLAVAAWRRRTIRSSVSR
jgi:hypothetical protein